MAFSSPGVQAKVSALEFSVPIGTTSGSAILELAPRDGFPQLVENENFFMNLARECGVPVRCSGSILRRSTG